MVEIDMRAEMFSYFSKLPMGRLASGSAVFLLVTAIVARHGFAAELADTEKEAITSIRTIVMQLILISVGVYAVVGGFLASSTNPVTTYWSLVCSFLGFGGSILFGLISYGALVQDLIDNQTSITEFVGQFATVQWVLFFIGGFFLMIFLLSNAKR